MSVPRRWLIVPGFLLLTSCGGGSNSTNTSGTDNSSAVACNGSVSGTLHVTGKINFEKVPHKGFGLDYSAPIPRAPARGVSVQAINANTQAVITSTRTDANGQYSLTVPDNTYMKVRVLAEMVNTGSMPAWQFRVEDNTQANAEYVMDGNSRCTGATDETRNLTALSGWGGSSYTNPRTAAPFAILDTIYAGVQLVLGSDATAKFPALNLYWSPNNTDISGSTALGQITTTHFSGSNAIYLLGDQNNDTDEYDPSVIAHEWGHYLEANFSRTDNIGGAHYTGDYLDMRVAFGEGFGNAFSSMLRNDPVYSDSNGPQQANGFGFNVETESVTNPGWYSESSVEKILYDLYDSHNDTVDADTLSLGFSPIWDVLVQEERSEPVFTSIFKFISALKTHVPGDTAAIDALIEKQNIHVSDAYATGETNNAGVATILPVFHDLTTATPVTNICVTKAFSRGLGASDFNVLGMNQYLRFTPPFAGTYLFTIAGSTGDPDAIFYNDNGPSYHDTSATVVESFSETLSTAREYMFEIYDYNMLTTTNSVSTSCYKVSVVQQ